MRKYIAALLVCLLSACGASSAAPDDTTGASPAASEPAVSAPAASEPAASAPAASDEASPIGMPDASPATGDSAPEDVVAQVSQLLEQQFNVPAENITVESVEQMEWPDGSLGCPEPGAFYTQAVVPGYLLTVSDGSQTYELHTNEDGSNVVVCENGRPAQP